MFPVENATMRLLLKRCATNAGKTALVAQVRSGRSDEPNFRPARNNTLAQSGRELTAPGFIKSHQSVRTPAASRSSRTGSELNRDTAKTSRKTPASTVARRVSFAREGPI